MRCIIIVFQLYSDPSTEGKFTTSFTRILFIFDDRFKASILQNIVDFHITWIGYTFVFWQYSSFLFCLIWIEIGWINANPSEKKNFFVKNVWKNYKIYPMAWVYLSGSECFLSELNGPRGAGRLTPCWGGWAWAIL